MENTVKEIIKYFHNGKYEYSVKTDVDVNLECITVEGTVNVTFWDGSEGWLEMAPVSISLDDIYDEKTNSISKEELEKRVKESINDDGFGVQKFNKANVALYLDIMIDIPKLEIKTSTQKYLGDIEIKL